MKISDNVSQILDLKVIQRDLILLKKCSKCSKSVLKRKSQLRIGGSSEKVKTHLGELVPKRKNTPILAPWYLAAHKPVWDLLSWWVCVDIPNAIHECSLNWWVCVDIPNTIHECSLSWWVCVDIPNAIPECSLS